MTISVIEIETEKIAEKFWIVFIKIRIFDQMVKPYSLIK